VSAETVAARYALAIFELGVETGDLPRVLQEIRQVAELYDKSPDLARLLSSPLVPEEARVATIQEVAERVGVSPLIKNALGVLARRRRTGALSAIADELDRLSDEKAGIARVTVVSAERLSESYQEQLTKELATMTGRKVVLEQKLDPELLAGVVVRIGDQVIDGSARSRLTELRAQLLSS
jgi:F-type H+-transporting ATPase subunit delta